MFGTFPDWLVALFTGLSAYFLWRSIQPKKPPFEIEPVWGREPPYDVNITVRNPDPDHTVIIREVWAEPRDKWDLRYQGQTIAERRLEPKERVRWDCKLTGPTPTAGATSISMPTIHAVILCNRLTHKYKITL